MVEGCRATAPTTILALEGRSAKLAGDLPSGPILLLCFFLVTYLASPGWEFHAWNTVELKWKCSISHFRKNNVHFHIIFAFFRALLAKIYGNGENFRESLANIFSQINKCRRITKKEKLVRNMWNKVTIFLYKYFDDKRLWQNFAKIITLQKKNSPLSQDTRLDQMCAAEWKKLQKELDDFCENGKVWRCGRFYRKWKCSLKQNFAKIHDSLYCFAFSRKYKKAFSYQP